MTNEVLNKIIQKAKALDFEVSRGYHPQRRSPVVYKQEICSIKGYDNGYFLIHENIIMGNTIEDSSYDIFEFDLSGNFVGKIEVEKLPDDFFRNKKPIHLLK
jgi:hypothetical protein